MPERVSGRCCLRGPDRSQKPEFRKKKEGGSERQVVTSFHPETALFRNRCAWPVECLPCGIPRGGPPLKDSTGRAYSSGVNLSRLGGMRHTIVRLRAIP